MESFDVMWVILHSLYFGALCAFVLICLAKLGVTEWYQIHRPQWMPRDCTFCFAWWGGVVICGLWWVFVVRDPHLIFCLPVIPIFTIFLLKQR